MVALASRPADGMLLPAEAQPLLAAFLPHITTPTYTRFVTPAAAAILATGRRTVANLLRTAGDAAPRHYPGGTPGKTRPA